MFSFGVLFVIIVVKLVVEENFILSFKVDVNNILIEELEFLVRVYNCFKWV